MTITVMQSACLVHACYDLEPLVGWGWTLSIKQPVSYVMVCNDGCMMNEAVVSWLKIETGTETSCMSYLDAGIHIGVRRKPLRWCDWRLVIMLSQTKQGRGADMPLTNPRT